MHGMILETNINRDDDGGLYAELIYNRAFQEKNRSIDGWTSFGEATISLNGEKPLSNVLPFHLEVSFKEETKSISGFQNGGFFGMKIEESIYNVSFFFRSTSESFLPDGKFNVVLAEENRIFRFASTSVDVSSSTVDLWRKFQFQLVSTKQSSNSNNLFFIEFPIGSRGKFEFNLISCFPETFKNRENGARRDIAQLFADLKPGFVRIPGGNDLEGRSIDERFIWNETIGPLENRPGRRGTWTGFNTEGFGLIEMMNFVEDLGSTSVLAVFAGYSLDRKSVPQSEIGIFVDEVVREIEFLTAPSDRNVFGAERARLGRSEPFELKFVEIGNEDFIQPAPQTYGYRWAAFYETLSKLYPNITFIATTTQSIKTPPAVDDHDYQVPQFFIENFRRYERVPRSGPKVLIGEFAVINDDDSKKSNPFGPGRLQFPSIKSAVAESIYRIGFERNSDIIIGGCYAPVLQNINDTQWTPNFIVFDADRVVKSTSYLAQMLFSVNLADFVLNSTASNVSFTRENFSTGDEGDGKLGNLYFIATKRIQDNSLIVKLASSDFNEIFVESKLYGSSVTTVNATVSLLTAGPGIDPTTVHNTIENPNAASIQTYSLNVFQGYFNVTVPPWSVLVINVPL